MDYKPAKQLKKYQIIYADPPWFYNKRNLIGKDGKRNNFGWLASNQSNLEIEQGLSPEEAVAKLYLKLNKK